MDRLRILIRTAFVPFLLVCLCAGQAAYGQAADAASWYEVEDLNRGLGPVPADVDRTTPRSSLESFLAEAREGDWHAAAQVLDLSAIPENEQRTRGAQLAMDFLVLLERKIVIDWYDLQDRPDGLDSRQASEAAMAGLAAVVQERCPDIPVEGVVSEYFAGLPPSFGVADRIPFNSGITTSGGVLLLSDSAPAFLSISQRF